MPHRIFFSWQVDTDTTVGRNLVRRALDDAITEVARDAEVDPADREMAVDSDSSGVPGSPPIVETIFSKIDRAAAFVSDMTYVATRQDGRRMPNPNVLIEHGWALRALTWRGVISVMNTAHGHPDQHPLPFDLAHFRRPIFYECPEGADEGARRAARGALKNQFIQALKAILTDDVLRAGRVPPPPKEPHPHDVALLARVRQQLPEPLVRFLRQHDFGNSFRRRILDPVYEISEDWVGAAFEFSDSETKAVFDDVLRLVRELTELTATRLYPVAQNADVVSPKTMRDSAEGIQPATLQAISAMNATASALIEALDVFERTARDRIRIAATPETTESDALALLETLTQDSVRNRVPVIVCRPRLILRMVPYAATRSRRLEPAQVEKARLRFPPDPYVLVQTGSDGYQWWNADPPRDVGAPNPEARWLARLTRPGVAEAQTTIGVRQDDDPEILVDGRELERHIVYGLERLAAALAELGLTGAALASISLDGAEDVILTRSRPGGRPIRQPFVSLPVLKFAELTEDLAPELHEALDILWQMSGCEGGSPSFGTGRWDGRDRSQ